MANRYLSEDGITSASEKSSIPETLFVDLQGDQRTRPIMSATEFSSTGIHKKKSTSFQITSVTVQGSRLSNDGGEDSADDLDESHTEDISSDILDCSKTTDLDNDPLSSDNSNANLDDLGVSVASKPFIPVKVLTNDPDTFGASYSIGVNQDLSVDNTVIDTDITLMAPTTTALPVITTQVPIVNSLPEHLQHRFKVVKIVSTEPFKRGRWLCMDFTDPPAIHGEQRAETSETTDTTHVTSSSFNTVPSDNPPSVAQFYEFPVNQTSISNVPQQQQTPQSVYGILLPVANNPGPSVTKVQNVGVQATPNLQVESVSHQNVTIQAQPIATQSQATQASVPSAPSVSLSQTQHVQVTPSSAQNHSVLPASQSQVVYSATSQISQPNKGMPATQPTQVLPPAQHQQLTQQLSQQVPPVSHQVQIASRNQPTNPIPVLQSAQALPITQPPQIIPGTQQSSTLPATQQPHVQTIQPNPIITTSLANQGIAVPSGHVIGVSQTAQGMSVPQPNQGLSISQANPGLPATQGINLPVVQPVLSSVQHIPISQPSQILNMSQAVQSVSGLPMQTQSTMMTQQPLAPQDMSTSQPAMGVPATQPNLGIPVTQPSQGLPTLQQTTSLPVQSGGLGLPITQTQQVIPTAQVLPITSQPISGNQPVGLPVTQSNTSLPTTQTVLMGDSHSSAAGIQPASSDTLTSSQPASKMSPPVQHQQGNIKDVQISATSAANPSPLLDILPDTLGTKTLQDGEESESASSGTNTVAIDNKIEQAMDLVKSHLMFAVREEVDVLKEKITELMDKINQLEHENGILKANATPEMLNQLNSDQGGGGGGGGPPTNPQQPPAATHEHP